MEDSAMDEAAPSVSALLDANMTTMDQSIDELFGDVPDGLAADGLGVPLNTEPLAPELVSRIAGMQTRGCCAKIAWSNTGSIARIKDHGRKIVFHTLRRNSHTGSWSLTGESKEVLAPSAGTKWEHVQFSNLGIDLAAVDTLGRATIYTLTGALGKMQVAPHNPIHSHSEVPRSDSDAVVGLHWLPVWPNEFRFPNISPATKPGEKWSTFMRHSDPSQPRMHHPAENRHALVFIACDGKITLMYQNEGVWNAVDARLGGVNSSADFISHAAMSEEDDHLLVVTHDRSDRLQLYKVNINWNAPESGNAGGQAVVVAPTLSIGHLTVVNHVLSHHAAAARLSQLRIVSSIPSNASDPNMLSFPTVFAISTRVSLSTDGTQQHEEAFSIISRWHVESAVPSLHEAFGKLKSNGTGASPQNTSTSLRRQDDIFTPKIVLSFTAQNFNTMLAFVASDATIEFRDRVTMASIEPYPDPATVSSLPQAGFEHLIDRHHVDVAMSADGSALAAVNADGDLHHKLMVLRYAWHPIMEDGGLLEAAVVCLARQYSILCCTNVANDETLALMPLDLGTDMRSLFVKEVIKMLGRNLDISMQDATRQQQMAVREVLLPKAISAQYLTGRKPGTMELTFAGKYAWAFLNMRFAATTLVQVFTKPDIFQRPEHLVSLRGIIQWSSDLLVFVADSVMAIRRKLKRAKGESVGEICEQFIAEQNNPVVHMLLCTFSRVYLRFLASYLPKFLAGVSKSIPSGRSTAETRQLTELFEMGLSLPFKYGEIEAFLAAVDTAVRDAYTQGVVTAGRRWDIELSTICCDPSISDELRPALQSVFESAVPKLMERADQGKLYFRDTSWLGIDSQARSQQYDVIRKLPLTLSMKSRVCRRCGSYMEEVSAEKMKESAPTLLHMGRHCVCTGYWIAG